MRGEGTRLWEKTNWYKSRKNGWKYKLAEKERNLNTKPPTDQHMKKVHPEGTHRTKRGQNTAPLPERKALDNTPRTNAHSRNSQTIPP